MKLFFPPKGGNLVHFIKRTKSAEVRGLENEIISLRTQKRLQQAQAAELAEMIVDLFSNDPSPRVQKVVELAAGILA